MLDLAVTLSSGFFVSVLLGNGDGSFASPLQFETGTAPSSVAMGDFNGDGLPDLAAVNYAVNGVSVLINDTPR